MKYPESSALGPNSGLKFIESILSPIMRSWARYGWDSMIRSCRFLRRFATALTPPLRWLYCFPLLKSPFPFMHDRVSTQCPDPCVCFRNQPEKTNTPLPHCHTATPRPQWSREMAKWNRAFSLGQIHSVIATVTRDCDGDKIWSDAGCCPL